MEVSALRFLSVYVNGFFPPTILECFLFFTHEYRSVSESERMRNMSAASSRVKGRRRRRGVWMVVKLGEGDMVMDDLVGVN